MKGSRVSKGYRKIHQQEFTHEDALQSFFCVAKHGAILVIFCQVVMKMNTTFTMGFTTLNGRHGGGLFP
jgi:hypothetical protein